jgi:hypothetical protein
MINRPYLRARRFRVSRMSANRWRRAPAAGAGPRWRRGARAGRSAGFLLRSCGSSRRSWRPARARRAGPRTGGRDCQPAAAACVALMCSQALMTWPGTSALIRANARPNADSPPARGSLRARLACRPRSGRRRFAQVSECSSDGVFRGPERDVDVRTDPPDQLPPWSYSSPNSRSIHRMWNTSRTRTPAIGSFPQ